MHNIGLSGKKAFSDLYLYILSHYSGPRNIPVKYIRYLMEHPAQLAKRIGPLLLIRESYPIQIMVALFMLHYMRV